mgnify:CR=1 FL=1
MNTLDIVILALFIPGLIRGISKGFLEQIVSLAGIVLSIYLAYKFSGPLGVYVKEYIHVSDTVLNVISFAIIMVVVLVLVILLGKLLTKVASMASLGWFNKALGVVLSVVTTAVVLSILAILFETIDAKFELVKTPILKESVLYNALKDLGNTVFPYLRGTTTASSLIQ